MSEQQQPKEYIITEKELQHAEEHHIKFIDDAKRIRSRPHPAPQAPALPNPTCPGCDQIDVADRVLWLQDHDAAIERNAREDEREKVLDALLEYGASDNCPVSPCPRNKDKTHDPWGCVKCIAKSLRHHSEQQEQPR